jgi:hypothetical protein
MKINETILFSLFLTLFYNCIHTMIDKEEHKRQLWNQLCLKKAIQTNNALHAVLLVKCNANIHKQDIEGKAPLDYAKNNAKMIKALLEATKEEK